jgi:hypothetical protein
MGDGLIIGGVRIVIEGDTSRLQADFANAAQIAQRAGGTVAANFNAGVAPGLAQTLVAVQNFGKGFQTGTQQAANAAYATWTTRLGQVAAAATATQQAGVAAAQGVAAGGAAAAAATPKVVALGNAFGATASQARLVGASLRVLQGQQGILAAERFLAAIPGVTEALGAAFPIIGAVALGEAIYRIYERVNPLVEAEKNLAEVTKQNDAEWNRLADTFEKLKIERLTTEFGALAGLKLKGIYDEDTASRDRSLLDQLGTKIDQIQKKIKEDLSFQNVGPLTAILQAFNPLTLGINFASNQDAKAQIKNLQAVQDQAETLREKIKTEEQQADNDRASAAKKAEEEAGSLAAARVSNQIAASDRALAAQRQASEASAKIARETAQVEIDALVSPQARAIAAAQEEVRAAQSKASQVIAIEKNLAEQIALIRSRAGSESRGKDEPERTRINTTAAGEIAAKRDEALQQENTLRTNVTESAIKLTATIATATREETKAEEEYQQKLRQQEELWQRINKESREAHSLERQAADLLNPEKGGTPIREGGALSGTPATRITEAQKTATEPGNRAALAQIGAELELQNARVQTVKVQQDAITHDKELLAAENLLNQPLQTRLALLEEILQKQIALAAAQGKTDVADKLQLANAQLAQTLTQWKALDIGNVALSLEGAAVKLPGEIGNALAAGIFQAPKKGESKGQEIGGDLVKAVKSAGQQLLGNLITQAIEKLISELIGQAAVAALQTSSTQALIASNATVVGALAANTAAQGAGAGASAAGGIAGGVGSAAGSVAGGAATGFIGPLISAAGGIIGGIISSITTWAGDAKIVAAVNGTTAAVNALGSRLGPQEAVASNGTASGSTVQNPNDSGSFNPFVNLLNGITAAGALPVSVVSISPIAPLAGIFKLFGFEGGGTPAIGVPALGGERGPEIGVSHATGAMSMIGARGPQIFTPREKMSIVPNHMAGAFLASRGMKGYADGAALSHFSSHTEKLYSSSISEHPGMKHFADGAALRMIPPMMPHEMLKGYAEGTSDVSTSMTSSHAVNIGSMHFATHGITDPDRFVDHVARKLPGVLKTRLPRLSPAGR